LVFIERNPITAAEVGKPTLLMEIAIGTGFFYFGISPGSAYTL
jgi:hypothetical protein